jgi:ubiquinone/menaquinone biosynthesis C-methylase UbiE
MNSWKSLNTIDYWRHKRMYENIDPLIQKFPRASWLTVGDGRYGTDANYILSKGIKNVIATDISDTYLKIALKEKFIAEYKVENAEALSFSDNSFDFALCKEAYHHFPRPMIALYEMLRVSKEAVIIIEPNDHNVNVPYKFKIPTTVKWFMQAIKNRIKNIAGREIYYEYGNYEPAGNYVYSISEREIEKVALGLNLPVVAFKGINDYYIDGVEYEEVSEQSEKFKKIKQVILKQDKKSKKGIAQYAMLVAIIFKNPVDNILMEVLEKYDFTIRILPHNPYVK